MNMLAAIDLGGTHCRFARFAATPRGLDLDQAAPAHRRFCTRHTDIPRPAAGVPQYCRPHPLRQAPLERWNRNRSCRPRRIAPRPPQSLPAAAMSSAGNTAHPANCECQAAPLKTPPEAFSQALHELLPVGHKLSENISIRQKVRVCSFS